MIRLIYLCLLLDEFGIFSISYHARVKDSIDSIMILRVVYYQYFKEF